MYLNVLGLTIKHVLIRYLVTEYSLFVHVKYIFLKIYSKFVTSLMMIDDDKDEDD